MKHKLLMILWMTFAAAAGVYIYLDTRPVAYQAQSVVTLLDSHLNSEASESEFFYHREGRLLSLAQFFRSPEMAAKLASDPNIQSLDSLNWPEQNLADLLERFIPRGNWAFLLPQKKDAASLETRLPQSIKTELTADGSSIKIIVTESNPHLAMAVANLIPFLYQQHQSESEQTKKWARHIQQVIQSEVTTHKKQQALPDAAETDPAPTHTAAVTAGLTKMTELESVIIDPQSIFLWQNPPQELKSLKDKISQIESELSRLPKSQMPPRELLSQLGLLHARMSIEMAKTITALKHEYDLLVQELQVTWQDVPAGVDSQSLVFLEDDDDLFKVLLEAQKDDLQPHQIEIVALAKTNKRLPEKLEPIAISCVVAMLLGWLIAMIQEWLESEKKWQQLLSQVQQEQLALQRATL